jgi:hypothetical protein
MNPPNPPSVNDNVVPSNVPAGSGTFDPTTSKPSTNSDMKGQDLVMGGVAAAAGMLAMVF